MMSQKHGWWYWTIVMLLVGVTIAVAQTKEERLYQIKLRRAEGDLEEARVWMEEQRRKHEETQQLFGEGLVTMQEANRAERSYGRAKLLYDRQKIALERLKLTFLEDALHLTIVEARTYRTSDGRRMAEVTLQNTSDVEQAVRLYGGRSRDEVVPLLEMQQILVSLTSGGGGVEMKTLRGSLPSPIAEQRVAARQQSMTSEEYVQGGTPPDRQRSSLARAQGPSGSGDSGLIVAEPYEALIPSLRWGETTTITFRLLQDLDAVGVVMHVLQRRQTQTIVLKKESKQDVPTVTSAQFSQEGKLNTKVTYDLLLERLAEDEQTFRLVVLNLPTELDATFVDPATGANLTQVKFTETVTKLQINLQIAIPEKLSQEFIDRTIEFIVVVTDEARFRAVGEVQRQYHGQGTAIPPEVIARLPGEKVTLDLIPRGKGAVEVLITNRYEEIMVGEEARIRLDIHNTGTLVVEDVQLDVRLPLEWEAKMNPERIGEIPSGAKEPVNLTVMPLKGIGIGEYEVEVKVLGRVGAETIESAEQVITIRVGARARVVRNTVVIVGLVTVVLGLVVVTIKVSRR